MSLPVALRDRTVTAVLSTAVETHPDRLAIFDKRTRLSYSELWDSAARFAGGFADLGIGRGDRVLLMLDNHVDFVVAWMGLNYLAAVEVPVNTAYVGKMLEHIVRDSGASVAVVEEHYLERIIAVGHDVLTAVIVRPAKAGTEPCPGDSVRRGDIGPRVIALSQLPSSPRSPARVDPWDIMALLYTSGTTGHSKGVLITHAGFHAGGQYSGTMAPGDVRYVVCPLFHAAGQLGSLYYPLISGASAYIAEKFSASTFWPEARTAGATSTEIVGPMADFLLDQEPSENDRDHAIREVYMVPITPRIEAFRTRFGIQNFVTAFGSTELGAAIVCQGDQPEPGLCGRPVPHLEVRLVDEHDIPVETGQVGEAIVRPLEPWLLTPGYSNRPEATANLWRNGWLHTGDGLYQDRRGNFHFVDRMRDHIRRRGENISSAEVEREVLSHPEVLEAVAVGVPAESSEDEVKIVVVRSAGSTLTELELTDYLVEQMPQFMVPRYVEFREALPKTENGLKVRKDGLRDIIGCWDRAAQSPRRRPGGSSGSPAHWPANPPHPAG